MRDALHERALAAKTLERERIAGARVPQELDRHVEVVAQVACGEDLAHRAAPERVFEPVAVDFERQPAVEHRTFAGQHAAHDRSERERGAVWERRTPTIFAP